MSAGDSGHWAKPPSRYDVLRGELPEGCTRERADWIVRRLDRNEYKRRQTPLVLRTSPKAFGSGRRLPIVHRYEG